MYCKKCGTEVKNTDVHCQNCGEIIAEKRQKRNTKFKLFIGFLVFAETLVILFGGIYFLSNHIITEKQFSKMHADTKDKNTKASKQKTSTQLVYDFAGVLDETYIENMN